MARTLTEIEIKALSTAVSRLTKRDVFTLTSLGFLAMDEEGDITRSTKGERALKRESKQIRATEVRGPVEAMVKEMLAADDAHIQHRAVWVAVGREQFERDEVLTAMRAMRDEGLLETVNTSGNNFQIFWKATPALNSQLPAIIG
jgi:hypothetical protein